MQCHYKPLRATTATARPWQLNSHYIKKKRERKYKWYVASERSFYYIHERAKFKYKAPLPSVSLYFRVVCVLYIYMPLIRRIFWAAAHTHTHTFTSRYKYIAKSEKLLVRVLFCLLSPPYMRDRASTRGFASLLSLWAGWNINMCFFFYSLLCSRKVNGVVLPLRYIPRESCNKCNPPRGYLFAFENPLPYIVYI